MLAYQTGATIEVPIYPLIQQGGTAGVVVPKMAGLISIGDRRARRLPCQRARGLGGRQHGPRVGRIPGGQQRDRTGVDGAALSSGRQFVEQSEHCVDPR